MEMRKVSVSQTNGSSKTYWCEDIEVADGVVQLRKATDREGGDVKWSRIIILQGGVFVE